MTEEIKKEIPKENKESKAPPKRIFAESRGKYNLIDNQKIFTFEFPGNSTLEENYAGISYIKEEIFKAIQEKEINEKKQTEEKKEE